MLKKLVKYDFLWIERVAVWYTLAALLCGGFLRAMDWVYNNGSGSVFWLVMDKIALSLTVAACVSLCFNAFLRTVARFVTTFYKDQSYFTHTLPVSRNTLYSAKALSGAAVMLLCLLGVGAAVLIAGGKALFTGLEESLSMQSGSFVLMVLLIVIETLCLLFAVYFGMVLGYRRNKAKGAWGALFSLGIYFAVQSVIMLVVAVIAAAGGDMAVVFKMNAAEISPEALAAPVKKICSVTLAAYTVLTAALFFLGRKAFAKGVNVD